MMSRMMMGLLIVALTTLSVVSACTNEGWVEFNGFCYGFSPEPLDWFAAAGSCQYYGARLVQIGSQAKQDWIVGQLTARGISEVWTGGTRRYSASVWQWIPGSTNMTYTNWAPTEPNNVLTESSYGEQCIQLAGYMWNDRWCGKELHFVCGKKAGS